MAINRWRNAPKSVQDNQGETLMGAKMPNPQTAPYYLNGTPEEGAARGTPSPGKDPRMGNGRNLRVSNHTADTNRSGGKSVTTPRGGGFGRGRASGRGR